MKRSNFVFDYGDRLRYLCHEKSLNRGGSYIDSPNWIKNGKTTKNPINKYNNKRCQ